ncbi:MAG: GntR family transcriptional regulator [Actinoallomurus sp.]
MVNVRSGPLDRNNDTDLLYVQLVSEGWALVQREIGGKQREPAYVRLRDSLRGDIESGRYRAGQWLPTEQELVAETGLSRHTVRAALDGLREDGLVSRQAGRGTMVLSGAGDISSRRVISTDRNLFGHGLNSTVELLQPLTLEDDPQAAARLSVSGMTVARLRFCRRLDDGPRIGVWDLWTPTFAYDELAGHVEELNGTRGALIELVEQVTRRSVARADQIVTAENADEAMAEVLGVQEGDALLRMERTYLDSQGYPMEHLVVRYVPKYFTYKLQLLAK